MPTIRLAPIARSEPALPRLGARAFRPAHRRCRRLFPGRGPRRRPTQALERVAKAVGARTEIEIPEAQRARAAAYVITATEGAALHLDRLRNQADDFDPAVRDRLIAGAMVPATLVIKAQMFRRWYREQRAGAVQVLRRDPGAGDALHRAEIGQQTLPSTASKCRCGPTWGSTPSRFRSSACRWSPCRCR